MPSFGRSISRDQRQEVQMDWLHGVRDLLATTVVFGRVRLTRETTTNCPFSTSFVRRR